MSKGKFIVIEGVRGVGKTTVIKHLKEIFSGNDNVVFTREPGGSFFAEKVRELMISEDARGADGNTQFGLIWASRADHVRNLIAPTLASGNHVITERFDVSTYGLQVYAQESFHLKELFFLMREAIVGENVPDLYVFLDVDPQEGNRRAALRDSKPNHFHDREPEYYARMREGYLEFLGSVPHVRIDTGQSAEKVKQECEVIVRNYLAL